MKMFELLPRPLGSIFRKLTHLTCNSRSKKIALLHRGTFDAPTTLLWLKSGRLVDLSEERNEYCLREIGYFFDFALNGAPNVNSIPYANGIVSFLL